MKIYYGVIANLNLKYNKIINYVYIYIIIKKIGNHIGNVCCLQSGISHDRKHAHNKLSVLDKQTV